MAKSRHGCVGYGMIITGSKRKSKKEDPAIMTGLRIYHNHVRPHLGLLTA